ncbi:MAG: hypothetical protein EOO39_15395 [Cytophagaceae bacterium]|nr:MAG: hypothetical protein EOO39_15395 [Cytophagaceae bacterium]
MKLLTTFLPLAISLTYAFKQAEFMPPDYFAIHENEVRSLSAGIDFVADTISLSICPKGAICFRADNAFVSLRVTRGTQSRRVQLAAFPYSHKRDSSGVDFGDAQYKVILWSFRCVRDSSNRVTNEVTVQVAKL